MTTLAIYTGVAIDSSGNAISGADVEVRLESTGILASIFSDEAATAPLANPATALTDASGRFAFYVAGVNRGFSVKVTKGADTYTLHNQAVGTAGQLDQSAFITPAQLTPLLKSSIQGLTYSNNVSDATNDIDIAAGVATDSTAAYSMALAASITKRLDAAWAVGTNQGGLDTGSIGNSDYYIHLIARPDTGVVDVLYSLSATAPTMPANYTYRRLIGWFKRVGGTIVAFHTYEADGGGIELSWDVPTLDINLANTLTTARRTDAVKVPLTFSVTAHLNVSIFDAGSASINWICCPDQTDAAPSGSIAPLANVSPGLGLTCAVQLKIRTSATGTIAARSTLATCDLYAVSTMGFAWPRRN